MELKTLRNNNFDLDKIFNSIFTFTAGEASLLPQFSQIPGTCRLGLVFYGASKLEQS